MFGSVTTIKRRDSFRNAAVLGQGAIDFSSNNLNIDPENIRNSYAFDINDNGQVVGWVEFKQESQAGYNEHFFIYEPGKTPFILDEKNAGQLFANSGKSIKINNLGQLIGTRLISYESGGYSLDGFLYDRGQIIDLSLPVPNEYNEPYDINNFGQVVGTSVIGGVPHAFLYNGNQTVDLNTLIPSNEQAFIDLESALDINDRGQIIARGIVYEPLYDEHYFLLNPTSSTTDNNKITIGNITTFGDSVLLQGGKINLTGETVTTSGGSVTIDGETIVNGNSLTIDSSIANDATTGGDITFKNSLDGVSAGTQNLKFKAGKGNILLEGAVGGKAAFKDLAVEGAGTVTAKEDIAVVGNLGLEVIDDIKTANISADGLINISLGKVGEEVFDSTGNVSTGNITALGLSVLNNGSFTAGDLETSDGDIDIISLDDLTVNNMTATTGGISLISGTAGITVNGTATSDEMLIALAKQTITTNALTSNQDAVILKSSKRAVRVNGAVTAQEDVSLAAVKNVVVGEITSADGGVALISATGKVRNTGAVAAVEDVIVGAAQDIVTKGITASLGTVGVVSTEGAVKVNGVINSVFGVEIAAQQNVTTRKIEANSGAVAIEAEQGEAFIRGNIKTVNENVYVKAAQTVNVRNIISKGGDISLISEQKFLKTVFLRSNRSKKAGGKVYLEAGQTITVGGSVPIGGTDYSIYTGVAEEGSVVIAHELGKSESERSEFIIGDTSLSGTKSEIYGEYALKRENPLGPYIRIIRTIERIIDTLENPPTRNPRRVNDINPITGQPYADDAERELVRQLTQRQRNRLGVFVNSVDEEEWISAEEFRRGTVNDEGCFSVELDGHLGDTPEYPNHGLYATYVTGSTGDFLVLTDRGSYAFFDGLVRPGGAIVTPYDFEPVGSVAEVKTQHEWLRKALLPTSQYYDSNTMTPRQRTSYERIRLQINIYSRVAQECGYQFFVSFDNVQAGLAGRELFEERTPLVTERSVRVHFIPPADNLYPPIN